MKKLIKLLALALAVTMLLPAAALAAENEETPESPKELYHQWLNWDNPVGIQEGDECASYPLRTEASYDNQLRLIFYVREENEKGEEVYTPIPTEKLTASEGLTLSSLSLRADPKDPNKDCYTRIHAAPGVWNKEYTISYEGCSVTVTTGLPDIGFYSKPEAATENWLPFWLFGTAPNENESIYMISTATDEANGRHLANAVLAKDVEDNRIFSLEKVSDDVYRLTRTGGINVGELRPALDLTWQDAEGGNPEPYTERGDFFGWANSSVLASEEPLPPRDWENPTPCEDVKDTVKNELTMEAGESKIIYATINYFNDDHDQWVLGRTNAGLLIPSDSAMTLIPDSEDYSKLTVRCDVPGTYTLNFPESALMYPEVYGVYHADGTRYTEAEYLAWDEASPYAIIDGEFVIYTDPETDAYATFEALYPGETIDFDIIRDPDYYPLTITVTGEAAAPAFTDVDADAWYAPAVTYANTRGYMNGTTPTAFDPEGLVKGSQLAQILYNKEGKPVPAGDAAFQGVAGQWYAAPVLWAAGEGIITDTGNTAVVPEDALTREQIALMLFNYMGRPEGRASLEGFADGDQVSPWALEAVQWAVSAKVLNGSDNGGVLSLHPAGTAKRCETAQILMNLFG